MVMLYSQNNSLVTMAQAAVPLAGGQQPSPSMRQSAGGQLVPFQPVGLYKPLTIMIHEAWTGKYPQHGFFLFASPQAMLLTSAMKGMLNTSAAPRAINFLTAALQPRTLLQANAATQPGSPLICYLPAVMESFYSLTIEMGFNTFNQQLFDSIASLFQQASQIPAFMPASQYLVAADSIIKLAADMGQILFNTGTVLSHNEPLPLALPGDPTVQAGFYLIVPDSPDGLAMQQQYHVNTAGRVVDAAGNPYAGDVPYVVISLDGTQQPDSYKKFTPLAATAAQISTFLGVPDGTQAVASDLVKGMQLASDLSYRQRADQVNAQIAQTADSAAKQTLEEQYKALLANINDPVMMPSNS